ncbi:single-stranded DNA-binding protein [Robertmurraya sp. FSL R5-0851]|uniref:single-stranded DNA-binding protein n=1 Tax=Robertmurraya sp. FSL R5-0851 TaxID=2921584 RepID=UPI0030F85C8E
MNKVMLTGRLTKDVELRGGENKVGVLTIAVNRKYTNQQGEREADFPQVKTFKKLADNCAKYLTKGSLVAIDAELRTGFYDKDGKRQYTMELIANDVEFLDSRKPSNNHSNATNGDNSYEEPPFNQQDPFSGSQEIDADIPDWMR